VCVCACVCVCVSVCSSAAEAVLNGHSGSILQFHQQQVPRSKLEQVDFVAVCDAWHHQWVDGPE